MECAMPTGKKFARQSRRGVGGELKVPSLVRHADDDQAETGPGIESLVDEVQLTRTVAHEHGGERSAEATATGVTIRAAQDDQSRRRSLARPDNMRNGLCN
jgi:hypothetical protein